VRIVRIARLYSVGLIHGTISDPVEVIIMYSRVWAMLLLSLGLSRIASADVVPPDVSACQGKTKGAACKIETSSVQGTCQDGKYCHLVYGKCDAQGGPCGSTCDPALTCQAGTSGDKGTGAVDVGARADGGTVKVKTEESGCTIGGIDARLFGPWVLAGTFAALLLLIRRRRSR